MSNTFVHQKLSYMKKLFLGITACLTLAATILVSCNKTGKEQNTPHPERLKKISATYGYTDFPTVEDGMLVFRDNVHYDNYIDFLDKAMASADPEDSTVDEHTILQGIEDGIGFTSIRNISHADFVRQDEIGWATLEQIPDEHFLNGIDLKSVLNAKLEAKIGSDLIHYINKDYMVRIDAGQSDLINKYRSLGIGATIDDILNIDHCLQFTTVTKLTGEGFVHDKVGPVPLGEYHILEPFITFPEPCNNPNLAMFKKVALHWNFEPGLEANFTVNYGDNSPVETKHSVASLGGYEVPWFNHTYPGPGIYTLTITGYLLNGTYATQRSQQVTVAGNCRDVEKNSDWVYMAVPAYPTRAVGGRLRIEYYGSYQHKMRMISETRSLEYKNGSWKTKKGRIEVEAKCSAKNDQCNEIDLLQAYQLKSNSKDLLEHRSKGEHFFWHTATSNHYLTIDNTRTMLTLTITSCP
jgi:hypothetical protein